MRARTLLVAALLLAAPATPASANLAQVAVGSCWLEVTDGAAECVVVLPANTAALFAQATSSGYGFADVHCQVGGQYYSLGGPYGTEAIHWSHGPEVCRLRLTAFDGRATAYVD